MEVFWKIQGALQSPQLGLTVDLRPPNGKLKFHGLGFSGGGRTMFKINFFHNLARDVVVVCARQQGCVILFNRLYQYLLNNLGDVVVRRCDGQPTEECQWSCPGAPSLSSSALSVMLARLLDRARSPVLDEQLGALEALLEFSQGESRYLLLEVDCRLELLRLVEFLLRADDDEVLRMGAVLLKNMLALDSAEFNQSVPQQLLFRMLELLEGPMTYLNRDAKRHLSAGLHCVWKTRQDVFTPEQLQVLHRPLIY